MQGQRPGGNPPFARKIFASDRAYSCEVISRVYAKRSQKIALYKYALLVDIATGGQIPWQRPVFYHFLVNNSNFFIIFMPMLPKNMSPIPVQNISVRHQRMAERITGQTDRQTDRSRFFISKEIRIEALHVTHYTVNMADCSSPFKRSVITAYHHSLSTA